MKNKNQPFPWGIYIGDLTDNSDTIPLCLDSRQGGFCVLFDDSSEKIANNFIENIALKLFEVLPIGDIVVDIFDFSHKKRFMHLSSLQNEKFYDIAYNQNSATNKFNTIEEIALNRHHTILDFTTPTISDYNQQSKFKEQYHLLIINLDSFPDEMTSQKRVKNFFNSAFEAGFYTIAFGNQEVVESESKAIQIILKKFSSIEIQNNQFKIPNELFNFSELLKVHEFEYINENKEIVIKKALDIDNSKEFLIFYGMNYFTEYTSYNNFISRYEKLYFSEFRDFINWTKSNNISEDIIPRDIKELKNLTSLDISHCKLENHRLPESIGSLTNLSKLKICCNELHWIPSSIRCLTNLTEFSVGLEHLSVLPDWIGELTNLTSLSIYHTSITELPESIGNLTNLIELGLNWNELETLPDSIGNLTNLTKLKMNSNNLIILPDSIGNLTNLTVLDIGSNKLTTLPDWIGNLTNLTLLSLGLNKFKTLPDNIGKLTNLTTIDIYKMKLIALPDSIKNLKPEVQKKLKKGLPLLKRFFE